MSEPFTTAQELELKSADAVIAALRAELDAERAWKRANVELAEQAVALRAERDEMRALLREARDWLVLADADGLALLARIDAALKASPSDR